MTTQMRTHLSRTPRGARAAAVSGAILLAATLIPSSAGAGEATVLASRTAWFWSSAEKVTTCTEDGVQNVCGDVSPSKGVFGNASGTGAPITQGHLGISVKDGGSDMRAYTKFDLGDIPFGSSIESFVARFTISKPERDHTEQHGEATGAKIPATFNEGQSLVQVCAVVTPWGASEGDPPQSTTVVRPRPDQGGNTQPETTTTRAEPDVSCADASTAEVSKDGKTLVADITAIAKKWGSGELLNEGIALLPIIQGVRPNWTLELHGVHNTAASANGTITFVTQAESARATVEFSEPVTPPPPPPPPIDDGPQFPSFGNPIPTDPGPAAPPVFGETPPATAPPAQGPTVPVGDRSADTPAWFFGLFPVGLLMLGFISGLIGPDPVAGTAAGAPSRVASVLKSRRLEDL